MSATVEEDVRDDLEEAVFEEAVHTDEGVEHWPRESVEARGARQPLMGVSLSRRRTSVSRGARPYCGRRKGG